MDLVCNFAKAIEEGNNLVKSGETLNDNTGKYETNINDQLSGWDSDKAKPSFDRTDASLIDISKNNSSYGVSVGNFIVASAKAIQSTDESLGGMHI